MTRSSVRASRSCFGRLPEGYAKIVAFLVDARLSLVREGRAGASHLDAGVAHFSLTNWLG